MTTTTLQILVSTDTNDAKGTTTATTPEGWAKSAAKIAGEQIGHGTHHNALIRVGTEAGEILHEERRTLHC